MPWRSIVPWSAQIMTTIVLLGIGGVGWWRGLGGLEQLEEYAVSIKLAVIVALLLSLLHHDILQGFRADGLSLESRSWVDRLRMLAGLLLVTQGFETARYLSAEYSPSVRIRSMQFAQGISGAIYVGFVLLIAPLLPLLPSGHPDETAIIDLSRHVALVLPLMLTVAAVTSQFSAAVADTLGAGGLVWEQSRGRLPARLGYLLTAGCAIALVWSANIFEIIAYASRAFAVYYLAQTVLALWFAMAELKGAHKWGVTLGLGTLATALAGIVIFAVPVE